MKNLLLHGFTKPQHKPKLLLFCLLNLGMSLFFMPKVQGQIYLFGSTNAAYYDIATNTWTAKALPRFGATVALQTTGQLSYDASRGAAYGLFKGNEGDGNSVFLDKYDMATNTWSKITKVNLGYPTTFDHTTVYDGNNTIYFTGEHSSGTNEAYYKYDISTSILTSLQGASNTFAWTMGDFAQYHPTDQNIYYINGNSFRSISIPELSTTVTGHSPAFGINAQGQGWIVAPSSRPNKLWVRDNNIDTDLTELIEYDIVTGTRTVLGNIITAGGAALSDITNIMMFYDGNDKIYAYRPNAVNQLWEYTISTNTSVSKGVNPLGGTYTLGFFAGEAPCNITATATASPSTCTAGGVANADGTLTLTAHGGGATKVAYSVGSTFTGTFASAVSLTAAPFTVANTLPNPTANQPYTIRLYCDETNFIDKTVILEPKKCLSSDLSLSVSPATATGNAGEYLTYTVTLTNGGPNIDTNVKVKVPMPEPKATLLSAQASNGSYDGVTKEWTIASLPVGTATLTFTVKVN